MWATARIVSVDFNPAIAFRMVLVASSRLGVLLLLLLLRPAATNALPSRPSNPVNLTLYHVGPASYPGLSDKNSGDAAGDAFFMLRAAGMPYLCSNSSGQRDRTFDCHDIEQGGADLVVSKYVVEADSHFSGYAECNVNASKRGVYDCECRDRNDNSGRRQLQNHHHQHLSVPCNATVGRILVLNESGLASHAPGPNSFMDSPYAFWYYNLAQKFVTGTWFSTLSKGECGNPVANGRCEWRVVQRVKTVRKKCQETFVIGAVEQAGKECFAACPTNGYLANRNSKCWTDCFYDTVVGPKSNSTAYPYPSSKMNGMPAQVLTDAWLAAFRSDDPELGGCPDVDKFSD